MKGWRQSIGKAVHALLLDRVERAGGFPWHPSISVPTPLLTGLGLSITGISVSLREPPVCTSLTSSVEWSLVECEIHDSGAIFPELV